jgi:sarcosine oxidase / L-pipecolate oxidase
MKSYENVQALFKKGDVSSSKSDVSPSSQDGERKVTFLDSREAVINASQTSGFSGSFGYVNPRSGWVDAEAAMRWLREQVERTKRVNFITGTVRKLLFSSDGSTVLGAVYETYGEKKVHTVGAALTIVAAGAWSPTLLDLRGRVRCSAQPLAYITISDIEAKELAKTPVQMNMSTGMFVIPPPPPEAQITTPNGNARLFLKVARHSHGWVNPIRIPHPEPHLLSAQDNNNNNNTLTISIPQTYPSGPPPLLSLSSIMPSRELKALHDFITQVLGPKYRSSISARQFTFARLCHYADTPTGDFLVDYLPRYSNCSVMVATGGSGHGFKFLPVLGEAIVKCVIGRRGDVEKKWVWSVDGVGGGKIKEDWEWGSEDGSRNGEIGVWLSKAMGGEIKGKL